MTTTTKAGKKYPRALIRRRTNEAGWYRWEIHLLHSPTEKPGEKTLITRSIIKVGIARMAAIKVDEARNEPEPTA